MLPPTSLHAAKVLFLAHETAYRHHAHFVNTEHILFGLVSVATANEDNLALYVLYDLQVPLAQLRKELKTEIEGAMIIAGKVKTIKTTHSRPVLNFTPIAQTVIDAALELAQKDNLKQIDTHHLLLGLLLNSSKTAQTMDRFQITTTEVLRSLKHNSLETLKAAYLRSPDANAQASDGTTHSPFPMYHTTAEDLQTQANHPVTPVQVQDLHDALFKSKPLRIGSTSLLVSFVEREDGTANCFNVRGVIEGTKEVLSVFVRTEAEKPKKFLGNLFNK